MRGRLRNWDSKITFFAFADVITSVCGMLIFITLLLATDLDRPAESSAQDTDPAAEQKLQETLRQQAAARAARRRRNCTGSRKTRFRYFAASITTL
jgi:hypothetical protein